MCKIKTNVAALPARCLLWLALRLRCWSGCQCWGPYRWKKPETRHELKSCEYCMYILVTLAWTKFLQFQASTGEFGWLEDLVDNGWSPRGEGSLCQDQNIGHLSLPLRTVGLRRLQKLVIQWPRVCGLCDIPELIFNIHQSCQAGSTSSCPLFPLAVWKWCLPLP